MTPTEAQLEALRTEAAMAGDHAMVAICTDAISGDPVALAECAEVIEAAAAMAGFLVSGSLFDGDR
jgi:hypothetical protein|tara:strand:+ start:142 stop:339 length:198 start_codon:yes stop_codon:yes gene_type:complete